MITMVLTGFLTILLLAGAVGLVDMIRASSWRRVAAERRLQWEIRNSSPTRSRPA